MGLDILEKHLLFWVYLSDGQMISLSHMDGTYLAASTYNPHLTPNSHLGGLAQMILGRKLSRVLWIQS